MKKVTTFVSEVVAKIPSFLSNRYVGHRYCQDDNIDVDNNIESIRTIDDKPAKNKRSTTSVFFE